MFRLQTNKFYSTHKNSRQILVALAIFGLVCGCGLQGQTSPSHVDDFTGHPRVVVISDIGNEPEIIKCPSSVCCSTRTNWI